MFLQILVSFFVAVLVYELILNFKGKLLSRISLLFWLMVWLSILVVVWFPGVTVYLASFFNIVRAIDVVVYLSIVVLFYLVFKILLKIERVDKKLEEFVRKEALKDEKSK